MNRQSRLMSLVESLVNMAVGFVISMSIQQVLFIWLWGINLPLAVNFYIVTIFTIASIIRSFVIRRIFEEIRVRS